MNNETRKYNRILDILRKSRPVLTASDDIGEQVIDKIRQTRGTNMPSFSFFDYVFGWVYIGWVRRGLIAVSVLIIGIFTYQQSLILRRLNSLERQTIFTESQPVRGTRAENEEELMIYKFTTSRLPAGNLTISERQIEKLIKTYNELLTSNKDLLKLIENDPELKQYIEKRLSENNKKKFNL